MHTDNPNADKQRKRRNKLVFILIMLGLCVISTIMFAIHSSHLNQKLDEDIMQTLQSSAKQSALTMYIEFNAQITTLSEISDRLSDMDTFDTDEAVEILKGIMPRYSFKRFGVALSDGVAFTTDDKCIDISDRSYFQESMTGKSVVSERLEDFIGGGDIIVFSTPVYNGEQVAAVLFGTYSLDVLQKILFTVTDTSVWAYIVNTNGDVIAYSEKTTDNIYHYLQDQEETVKQAILYSQAGCTRFQDGTEDKYIAYIPLQMNDWTLVQIVPKGALDVSKNYVMQQTNLIFGAAILIFLIIGAFIIVQETRKNAELRRILEIDSVTGGYTFRYFLQNAPLLLRKNPDRRAALLVVDIVNFKLINELFGYATGDEMLRQIHEELCSVLDRDECVARVNADKFVCLVFYGMYEALQDKIRLILDGIPSRWSQPGAYQLLAKIGVYLLKGDEKDLMAAQNYAVMALSAAKKEFDKDCFFYNEELKAKLLAEKKLEDDMANAYKTGEFIVYYQPKYDAYTRRVCGAEALIRWARPDGTILNPASFIPVAEKSGFILKLDEYVFRTVCKQQKERLDKGIENVPISVNLSRESLLYGRFAQTYGAICSEYGVPRHLLEIEVTERAVFEDQGGFNEILSTLRSQGFKILIDDFGRGYSSLISLREFPVDGVKLDKEFIDHYLEDKGKKIIECVIRLASVLGLHVTAEGVEMDAQYRFLKEIGCDTIQGFLFAKPMPEEAFNKLLSEN